MAHPIPLVADTDLLRALAQEVGVGQRGLPPLGTEVGVMAKPLSGSGVWCGHELGERRAPHAQPLGGVLLPAERALDHAGRAGAVAAQL